MNPSPASGEPQPELRTSARDGRQYYALAVAGDRRRWLIQYTTRGRKTPCWIVARWPGRRVLGRYESRDDALEAARKDQLM